ncbi:MAG: hypothetical protein BAJATHORv1_20197 [Candidatus Thorarchaeota archaeon]|nr:MAG: hypothetical protein BAJATHORv1_20197 [Candidatus Thorarchaeota archaeon]
MIPGLVLPIWLEKTQNSCDFQASLIVSSKQTLSGRKKKQRNDQNASSN